MSGIALSYGNAEEGKLASMLSRIKHRGGSQEIQVERGIGLGLISCDEESPHEEVAVDGQIMWADAEDCCGRVLTPEQLYRYYLRYGTKCIRHLNGAYAFALAQGGKLFVARDPFGLKPLYYGIRNGTLYFASEIKALLDVTNRIKPVPPGHYFHTDEGWVSYFSGIKHNYTDLGLTEVTAKLRGLVTEAVALRTKEQGLGIFLSGGIDSSVVAAAAKETTGDIKSFAVGSPSSSDLPKARLVADHLGLEHHELIYTPEQVLAILPEVIYHLESFDQYLVRSSVVNYLLAKSAAEHGISQVLCGEGGDELFAGYSYLQELSSEKQIEQELDSLTLTGHANGFQRVDRMTSAFALEGHLPFMDQAVAKLAFSLPISWKLKEGNIEKWILRQAFANDLPEEIVWRKKMKFFEGAGSQSILGQYAEETITDQEYQQEKEVGDDFILRSKEELLYFRIYREYFPHRFLLDTIGRTQTISK